MRARRLVSLVLLAACSKAMPREPEPPPPKTADSRPQPEPPKPEPPGLPAEFKVEGTPEVRTPFLGPGAMWRFLVSRLTTLRADARAGGEDILVTFEHDAVHVTARSGARRTWRLPARLRLEGGPAHVLLGSDLTTTVYGSDGAQLPAAEEITVIRARVEEAEGKGDSRLVIKGGRGFQTISTHR
ncbi:MAG: hypothetical protein ACYS0K_15530 [Planctomycetota bacterium]|jgi:hypothetical protein